MAYILIVEDDMVPRDALQLRVENLIQSFNSNYEVKAVEDIEKARLEVDREPPIGILLDIMLPLNAGEDIIMNGGLELARELRQKHPDIPIILITGRGDIYPEVEAKNMEKVRFFRKPMPGLEFRKALKKMLERGEV